MGRIGFLLARRLRERREERDDEAEEERREGPEETPEEARARERVEEPIEDAWLKERAAAGRDAERPRTGPVRGAVEPEWEGGAGGRPGAVEPSERVPRPPGRGGERPEGGTGLVEEEPAPGPEDGLERATERLALSLAEASHDLDRIGSDGIKGHRPPLAAPRAAGRGAGAPGLARREGERDTSWLDERTGDDARLPSLPSRPAAMAPPLRTEDRAAARRAPGTADASASGEKGEGAFADKDARRGGAGGACGDVPGGSDEGSPAEGGEGEGGAGAAAPTGGLEEGEPEETVMDERVGEPPARDAGGEGRGAAADARPRPLSLVLERASGQRARGRTTAAGEGGDASEGEGGDEGEGGSREKVKEEGEGRGDPLGGLGELSWGLEEDAPGEARTGVADKGLVEREVSAQRSALLAKLEDLRARVATDPLLTERDRRELERRIQRMAGGLG